MFSIVLVRRDETLPLTRSWLFPLYCGEFLPLSLSFATSEENILVEKTFLTAKMREKIRSGNEIKESFTEASLLETPWIQVVSLPSPPLFPAYL